MFKNKIEYFLEENISSEKIAEKIIPHQNKIIGILGNKGCGKTVVTMIMAELLSQNKKILMIEDTIPNKSIRKIMNLKNNAQKTIKIKNNLFLFNIDPTKKNNHKIIISEINKIKNNYDYIFIEIQNLNYHFYQEIINETIIILNANMLEMNKMRQLLLHNQKQFKIILNYDSENNIHTEIIKNIFKNKIKIIGKIKYDKKYNLFINHQFNLFYLNKSSKNNYIKIIKKIMN